MSGSLIKLIGKSAEGAGVRPMIINNSAGPSIRGYPAGSLDEGGDLTRYDGGGGQSAALCALPVEANLQAALITRFTLTT